MEMEVAEKASADPLFSSGKLNHHYLNRKLPPPPPSAPFQPPRQSVGRNLEAVDFPPSHEQPTIEEVMEDIREATLQYINCPDPMESAARKQRVLQSEMNGDVEEAATRILQASTSSGMADLRHY